MVDVEKLSDAELRTKLLEFGFPVMPITGTTRKVMAKKLKFLLENKNKTSSDGVGRRSLGRYSSEEDSDSDIKVAKKKENRRATMAAPVMQPPSATRRKSTRLNETEVETSHTPPIKELKSTISSTTTRTHKIIKSAQDEFDTGSESESDILTNNYSKGNDFDYKRSSPIKTTSSPYASSTANRYSPPKPIDVSYSSARSNSSNASPGRYTSYNSPSLASEYATDRLNQIRSRLSLGSSGYDKPLYSSPAPAVEKEETPFLSNFTKRLSAITTQKNDYDYKNDIIKEHDTNGASFARNQLSGYRATRGRGTTYDYKLNQYSILKNNFVSFAVLAGAALFFIFLAIMYLGMRSDTSVIPAGIQIPNCDTADITSKKGINCLMEDDITTAIHLLNVLKPELQKRAVANKCFDLSLKPHMTESEIITFCKTNFGIKDEKQISNDLRNLEILSFNNPDWKINVVQTENNNGLVNEADIAKDMESVLFNYQTKITSLVIFNPDVPWKCQFYNAFYWLFNTVLVVAIVLAAFYVFNLGFKNYSHYRQKQKDEIGFMVEKIIDILQTNAAENPEENYVVINHVRDMILPVKDRQGKEGTWTKAVKYINENESRVRTEVQEVQGEPFEVWRWIGSANLSMSGDRSDYIYRQGRRIVDAQYLITEVLKFPHKMLYFCSSRDIEIKNEVRDGFLSILLLRCKHCNKEHPVCSEDPTSDLMSVNLALVAGIVSLNLNLYHLNEICSAVHIPAVSGQEFNGYLDEIYKIYNESLSESDKSLQKTFDEKMLRTSTPKRNKSVDFDYETKKQQLLKQLEKTPEEIEKICKLTINQSSDSLWYEERRLRLTASNFGRIFKLLDSTDRNNVVNELLHSKFTGNTFTKYGQEMELSAIKDFERIMGQSVVSCGLFIHREYPFLAATPDGLIGNDGLLEVKCPYKAKDLTPEEAIKQKKIQFAVFENGNVTLKRSDRYYYQVQGQLFVTGREFCYFIIWTPQGLVYEKIVKDQECWDKMFPKLEKFYFEHLLPALLKEM